MTAPLGCSLSSATIRPLATLVPTRPASSEGIVDIIAHAISTTAGAVAAGRTSPRKIRPGWALFFGVVPDLVPFAIPACLRIWWWVSGASPTLLPTPNGPHFEWVSGVYNCSHSLLVFAVAFAGLWLIVRRPILEMLGWPFHILLDIFTHGGWFAIQFLWPVSSVHVNGLPWETGWFLAATYVVLTAACVLLWRSRRSPRAQAADQPHR